MERAEHHRAMRDSAPVWRDPATGCWHVYRYDDVATVLSDHRAFSSALDPSSPDGGVGTMDPPRHHEIRGLVGQAFGARTLAALEPRVGDLVEALLDRMRGRDRVELVGELAYPLPMTVVAELLGVPTADRDRFRAWAGALLGAGGDGGGSAAAIGVFRDYLRDLVVDRRARPRADLLSELTAASVEGRRLTDEQVVGLATELLLAGQLTTTTLLGSAVVCLCEHPEAQAALRAEPRRIPSAVEEVMRYRSPVVWQDRLTVCEVRLGGEVIAPGQVVRASLLSANHDERRFERPERFDAGRHPNPHVGFGRGIHFCLGAPLARLEARVALTALLRRWSRIALDPEQAVEYAGSDPDGAPVGSTTVRGLSRVPLTLTR